MSRNITWVDDKTLIKPIRDEIWRLVQQAPNMETIHWYVALDDCFENDEFMFEEAENMRQRICVLKHKGEHVDYLYSLIHQMLSPKLKQELAQKKGFPMSKYTFIIKPLSKFDRRENVANDQFYLRPDGRLFVVYDDDHDDENEDGSHPLHDVTDQYEVTIVEAGEATHD